MRLVMKKTYLERHTHIGEVWGRLVVVGEWSNGSNIWFKCKCSCGNEINLRKDSLFSKKSVPSCGCYVKEHGTLKRGQHDPRGYILARARERSKRDGREFDLTKEDIIVPEVCPLLGIKINPKGKDRTTSPSLDRKDPTKGYTPDNVWVISSRANTLKNNGTLDEFKLLVENWNKM